MTQKILKTALLALLAVSSGCGDDAFVPNTSPNTVIPNYASTTLSTSTSNLALSINGKPRSITITNAGSKPAYWISYTVSSLLPNLSNISSTCGTLLASASCTVTITPGSTPSAAAGDTNPIPITLSIVGANTNTLTANVNVLTYGSVYQSGYVFSIDDTTATTGSIGGKVTALTDQSSGVIWSSNGTGGVSADVDDTNIPGITEISTTPCNGNIDGTCDTTQLVTFYTGVNADYYAAGVCTATIGGFSDWYLPAICEMGYDSTSIGSGCGTQGSPLIQNIQSNLVDNGNIGSLSGIYWSSTEYSSSPTNTSIAQNLGTNATTFQTLAFKNVQDIVRCVRAITN